MLVFVNFGGGRYWWLGPLFGIGVSLVSSLVQEWIADRRRRHEWEADEYEDGGLTFDAIDLVLLLVLAALVYKGVQMVRQRGGLRAMLQQRHQQQQAAAATAAARRTAQQRRPDFDRVVAALQRLPTEVVATKDDLERESVHDLKQRLINMNVELPKGCMEKGDLVAKVLEAAGHGSDGESCVICAEEYAPGDVVRVLPCRHRMHLECIDRWLLKSIEHSAPKGCPLCNDERWLSA